MVIRRRTLIKGALAGAALFSFPLQAKTTPRWVILDWGITEMALLLGITPVGVAAPDWYRRLFSQPPLPEQVADVGLLFQPNYETLFELRPDALLVTPAHRMAEAQLFPDCSVILLFVQVAPTPSATGAAESACAGTAGRSPHTR